MQLKIRITTFYLVFAEFTLYFFDFTIIFQYH